MALSLAFLIGFLAGLRSLAPPAAVAWATHLGWLKLQGALALMGSLYSVGIFTVLALGELGADKWARIPARTSAMPLVARILTGGLTGACVAAGGGESLVAGAVLGAVGGVAGALAGFQARRRLVQALRVPDWYVAVLEDVVVIAGCVWVVSRFS
jgi:uncharacterized membrane protein